MKTIISNDRRKLIVEKLLESRQGIDKNDCWIWGGLINAKGYGTITTNKGHTPINLLAHRVMYENIVGLIPKGLELDHLCETPLCVNPKHLEPVTHRVNMLRGSNPPSLNYRKTHCPQGHEYSIENTANKKGERRCKTCHTARERKRYHDKKRAIAL